MNKVILIGRVGKDPEVITSGETKMCKFSLATSEYYKDKAGQRQQSTEWHNIVIWGALVDSAAKYIKKGDEVSVEGKIKTTSYEKDGVKKYSTSIYAERFSLHGRKPESAPSAQNSQEAPIADDLPF